MKLSSKWSQVAIALSLLMLALVGQSIEQKTRHQLGTEFIEWLTKHNRNYQSAEEFAYRFWIYSERDAQLE